jgi:hypothetical protein
MAAESQPRRVHPSFGRTIGTMIAARPPGQKLAFRQQTRLDASVRPTSLIGMLALGILGCWIKIF